MSNEHDFTEAVREAFRFLIEDGFREAEASPTLVKFERGKIIVNVFLGRRSNELGAEIVKSGQRFSLSEIIRTTDPAKAASYRSFATRSADDLPIGLQQLSALLQRHGPPALDGDLEFFGRLEEQRRNWSETYAMDVLAGQLRPTADAAFRKGDYAAAADLYGKIRARLDAAELKKLAIAERRRLK